MSAYRVGTGRDGGRVWWENREGFHLSRTEVRDAMPDEVKIMDRFVWKTDRPGDGARLKELILRK